jgi:iron-sulfur cluster assembly protein
VITVTEAAKEKIRKISKQLQIEEGAMRIGVRSGGCSGLMFVTEMVETPDATDRLFTFDDIVIAIDKKSYLFLVGLEIDYEDTLMRSGFKYNMSDKRKCGCGESFTA